MPRTTKSEGGGKRHPLNMRTTRETRERLEAAAAANGRSLTQEVEARLERSFAQDQQFGDPALSQLAFTLAAHFAVETGGEDWRTDAVVYTKGVTAVMDQLIRAIPDRPDKRLAIEAIAGRVLTLLAQAKEQDK